MPTQVTQYELIPSSDDPQRHGDRHLDSNLHQDRSQRRLKAALLVVLCILALAFWSIYNYHLGPSASPNTRTDTTMNKTEGRYSVG